MALTPDPAPSLLTTTLRSSPLYKLSRDVAASQALLKGEAKGEKTKNPVAKQKVVVSGQFRWFKKTGAFVAAISLVTGWDYFVRRFHVSEPHPEDEMRVAFTREGWAMLKQEASAEMQRRERLRWMRLRWSLDEGKWK